MKNDTTTPETDKAWAQRWDCFDISPWDLARKLERERDEARKLLEAESRDAVKISEILFDLERELDEAREQLAAERSLADRLVAALDATRWDSPVACQSAVNAWKEARK